MVKKYRVTLTEDERTQLQTLVSTGKSAARTLTHARILLLADDSSQCSSTDAQIVQALTVGVRTVERVRQRFVEESLEAALTPRPRSRRVSKLEQAAAEVVELAKSDPPQGRKRWTLRLLADQVVQLASVDGLSHESVRQILKKTE